MAEPSIGMYSCLADAGPSSAAYRPVRTHLEKEGRKDERRRWREKKEGEEESRKWIKVE